MIYDIFRWIGILSGYPAHLLFFKKKIYYENKASQSRRVRGGALIISNHFNPLDFVLNVVVFFPRKLFVVAGEDAFRNKLQSFGMRFWGGIEANRKTRTLRFIAQSANEIKKGHLVQIFPEGHNTDDGTIKAFYPSYVLIALRAKAPIIPVVIDGNYGPFKRTHLIIGEKIDVMQYLESERFTKEDVLRINDIVRQKVLDLREELDRRIEQDKQKRKGH
ncbi:MAG: 1-acyl-sn-glycerol-3-phosphate acyltransferase [Clostridia bacterium]|nr:1-acyl-sn-glycerol-3-phosphate acyltransferase [Clostridia bacterium]